jgi:hypothetical protein
LLAPVLGSTSQDIEMFDGHLHRSARGCNGHILATWMVAPALTSSKILSYGV